MFVIFVIFVVDPFVVIPSCFDSGAVNHRYA
jgi:hypothetical protein